MIQSTSTSQARAIGGAAASFMLLVGAMLTWPELFVFRKYLMVPGWAQHLPMPGNAGVYLSTAALLPVAWGIRGLARAARCTAAVMTAAPLLVLAAYATQVHWGTWLLPSLAFNFAFVVITRLVAPALALLALRWAVQTWIRL